VTGHPVRLAVTCDQSFEVPYHPLGDPVAQDLRNPERGMRFASGDDATCRVQGRNGRLRLRTSLAKEGELSARHRRSLPPLRFAVSARTLASQLQGLRQRRRQRGELGQTIQPAISGKADHPPQVGFPERNTRARPARAAQKGEAHALTCRHDLLRLLLVPVLPVQQPAIPKRMLRWEPVREQTAELGDGVAVPVETPQRTRPAR
jgi:hypothetical protein